MRCFCFVIRGIQASKHMKWPLGVGGCVCGIGQIRKQPPWLADGNKWCGNKVETRDVHCALIPLRGSQQTHIVTSVSKVALMRITQMPCDHTHNHAWRVAHQISLHEQLTHRFKRGITMAACAHRAE